MKQSKLVKKVYRACIEHNDEKLFELRKKEFAKIFKHKAKGKLFTAKWALVQI